MSEIHRDMIYKDFKIYIDDSMISSRTYKQHVQALQTVLHRLQDQQFSLKASKCQFFNQRLDIL